MPRIHRKTPETDGPITPVTEWSEDVSFSTWSGQRPYAERQQEREHAKTIVEWPRENQKPTDSGLPV